MDYTQLDIEHKREILTNLRGLMLAIDALAEITDSPEQQWGEELTKASIDSVCELTDEEVEQLIQNIESNRGKGAASKVISLD